MPLRNTQQISGARKNKWEQIVYEADAEATVCPLKGRSRKKFTQVNCSHSKRKVHLHSRHAIIYYYTFLWITKDDRRTMEELRGEFDSKWNVGSPECSQCVFLFVVLASHSPCNFMLNVLTQTDSEQNNLMDFLSLGSTHTHQNKKDEKKRWKNGQRLRISHTRTQRTTKSDLYRTQSDRRTCTWMKWVRIALFRNVFIIYLILFKRNPTI